LANKRICEAANRENVHAAKNRHLWPDYDGSYTIGDGIKEYFVLTHYRKRNKPKSN